MIDYVLLGEVMEYYKSIGYEEIDVPWLINEKYDLLTRPNNKNSCIIDNDGRHFVASAEQGFLSICLTNGMKYNKVFVSCTPCIRLNDCDDNYHQETFMKIELSAVSDTEELAQNIVKNILINTKALFNNITNKKVYIEKIEFKPSICHFDLMIDGIEVGSYGYREIDGCYYVFGTGLALPRLSKFIDDSGYHKSGFVKYNTGTLLKIKEEINECIDAEKQNDKLLLICELADVIGAVKMYIDNNDIGVTINDLDKFSQKTINAFKKGKR